MEIRKTMALEKIVVISREDTVQQSAKQNCEQLFVADDLAEASDIIKRSEPDLIIVDLEHVTEPDTSLCDSYPTIYTGRNSFEFKSGDFIEYGSLEKDLTEFTVDGEIDPCDEFFCESFAAEIPVVGKSAATMNSLNMIRTVAASNCNPVLIVGQTGTGKELAAKAVHNLRCPNEKFVAVNCAALTANLLESELFGHVKGAFTGADQEKTGLLELAGSGVVFLDEISEMPLDLQAKLLRVIQERNFRKVGGIKDINCRATIIASSNRNLKNEVESNKFRKDLYYRLNICPIRLLPLCCENRKEDIELLAKYFLQTSDICPDKKGQIKSFTKMALEALENHDWPGNARELKNVVDRAILMETTDKIGLKSIIFDPDELGSEKAHARATDSLNTFSLEKAEKELIAKALQETGWQKTKAASLLGITRATLYSKVKQYNIENNSKKKATSREAVAV